MQYEHKYNSIHDYKMDFVEASSNPFNTVFTKQIQNGIYTETTLKNFVSENIPNILYSTGNFITQLKEYDKLYNSLQQGKLENVMDREIDNIRSKHWFYDTPLIIDSGGHQLIEGHLKKIDRQIINEFSTRYFNWLKHKQTVNMGFSLDIHADRPMVSNVAELYELNRLSISNMLDIFENDISKIVWVYQFRTKNLNKLWLRLMEEFDIFKHTHKHSIGGVAQFSKRGTIKFPIYIPPAAITIKNLIEHNGTDKDKYFLFHILGVMNPTDLIQFALIQRSAERFHGLHLHVTLDSSKIFRGQSVGAFLEYMLNGKLYKISFKSSDLHKRSPIQRLTNEQLLRKLFDQLDSKYGFLEPKDTRLYVENDKGGFSFNKGYWSKIILLSYIHLNKLITRNLEVADRLIDFYEQGDIHKFNRLLDSHQHDLNATGKTKALVEKTQNLHKGVQLLQTLDTKYSENIIDRLFPELDIFRSL